ncbi:hypothetical protein [Lentzea tibetensis]|nr:hypothetical protein [Lentzea tibetensis]
MSSRASTVAARREGCASPSRGGDVLLSIDLKAGDVRGLVRAAPGL